jgi:hypothetical protein
MFYLHFSGSYATIDGPVNAIGPFKTSSDAHFWYAENCAEADLDEWGYVTIQSMIHPDDTVE